MQTLPPTRIRILVAYANPLIAVGLAAALRPAADFEVQVEGIDEPSPDGGRHDLIVADYDTGLRLAAERAARPMRDRHDARLVVMSAHEREHEVRRALEQGVHGYLPLDCAIDEFVRGVRTVAAGSRYLAMSTAQCMADSLTREALTAREAEVLDLLACGQCNKSIARELEIAVGTVKAHVKAIMAKLDASSRTQAVSVAAQRGLVAMAQAAGSGEARLPRAMRAPQALLQRGPAAAFA